MKWFPLARMKDLLKNKFTLDGNKNFDYQKYLKNEKKNQQKNKRFPLARKSVSTSQNQGFVSDIRFH